MTRLIKAGLCVAFGFSLGYLTNSMYTKLYFKKHKEEIAECFGDRVLDEVIKPQVEEKEPRYAPPPQGTLMNESIKKPDIRDIMKEGSPQEFSEKYDPRHSDEEPYLVSENALDYEDDNYDMEVAYTYYQDGILTDENDEPVENPNDILPTGWQDCFGWNNTSDDKFYAIDPKLRILFEVVRVYEPYSID